MAAQKPKTQLVLKNTIRSSSDPQINRVLIELVRELGKSNTEQVYLISGATGMGKTFLSQRLFEREREANHFDRVWFFNPDDFLQGNILSAKTKITNDLISGVRSHKEDTDMPKKNLFIFDGLDRIDPMYAKVTVKLLRQWLEQSSRNSRLVCTFDSYLPAWNSRMFGESEQITLVEEGKNSEGKNLSSENTPKPSYFKKFVNSIVLGIVKIVRYEPVASSVCFGVFMGALTQNMSGFLAGVVFGYLLHELLSGTGNGNAGSHNA